MGEVKTKLQVDAGMTRKVAELARLELTEEEVQTFTSQLANILKYVDLLNEVNTQGVEPMTHAHSSALWLREDQVESFPTDSDGSPKVLGSAPEVIDGGFKVPPIL